MTLDCNNEYVSGRDLINAVHDLSYSLETLALSFHSDHELGADLFALTFPHLRYLSLDTYLGVDDPTQALDFCARHPNLESLDLRSSWQGEGRWFPDHISSKLCLLPNLKHLKVECNSSIPLVF